MNMFFLLINVGYKGSGCYFYELLKLIEILNILCEIMYL